MSLDATSANLTAGDTKLLTATVEPADTETTVTDKTVKWNVGGAVPDAVKLYSDEACETPLALGEATSTLQVYAQGMMGGVAIVTVTATNGTDDTADDKSASCDVRVIRKEQTIFAEGVSAIYGDTGKKVSATTDGDGTLTYAVKDGGDVVGVDAASGALTIKKVGTATVTVTAVETGACARASEDVTVKVDKATVTVRVKDQSIYVGDAVPSLEGADRYTVTGLVGTDALTTIPTLAYQRDGSAVTPDNTKAGTYDIVAFGASGGDNYAINYESGTLTISAKSEPATKSATLTFDLGGGMLDGKTGTVTVEANVGDTIKLPGAPTRDGYTFRCWKGSEYAAGADYKVEGDHSFTAEWTQNSTPAPTPTPTPSPTATCTVTSDANGGTGKRNSLTAEVGTKLSLTANAFTLPGYVFTGWNTQKDGRGTSYKDGDTVELTGDVTLYAQWERDDYPSPTMSNSRDGKYTSTSEETTYTVSQAVPDFAASLRVWVDLEDVLYLTSDEVTVQTGDGETVGSDVAGVSIDGQRVTVTVDDAASLRGRTLTFSYRARLREGVDLSPHMNAEGSMASVPYQAHTVFDGDEGDVKHSTIECANFRLSSKKSPETSPSGRSSGTSQAKASSSGSTGRTLANTGDPTPLASVVTTAIAGAGFVLAGRRRR